MAPHGWTSPEQLEFLQNRMGAHRDAKAEGTVTRFHQKLYHEWFQTYPERAVLFPGVEGDLTPEQTVAFGEAIQLRKNVSSIHYNCE